MENQDNLLIDEKLKKLKIDGIKNISLVKSPSDNAETILYVNESFSNVKTVVNMDGKLEIFIEKNRN